MSGTGAPSEELYIEIRTDLDNLKGDLDRARKELDGLKDSGKDAGNHLTKQFGEMKKAARELVVELVGITAAIEGFKKFVEVNREFAVLNSSLITSTGSAQNAAIAFSALQRFAQTTPYDLKQAVEGFNLLVNLGLNPSERAMTSYGNTAAAMGKDMKQMIEAVADAAVGEFERLKEFGIKARNHGDTIAFTFRGVTETVKNNSKAIEEYLIKLGENNFGGAMAQRMATLDGAMSNLKDTSDQFFLALGNTGAAEALSSSIVAATNAIQELTDTVSSGQLGAMLDSVRASFGGWGTDIVRTATMAGDFLREEFKGWVSANQSTVDFLIQAFEQWPENVRALIRIITTELAYLAEKSKVIGHAIAANLDPTDGEWVSYKQLRGQIDALDQARMASLESIAAERDKDVAASQAKAAEAKKLREAYDAAHAAKAKLAEDQLAQFGVGKDGGPNQNSSSTKPKVIDITNAYLTDANSAGKWMQDDVNKQIAAQDKAQEEADKFLNSIREQNMTELELLDKREADKAAKLQEYRDAGLISEQAYNDAVADMTSAYTEKRRGILEKQYDTELKMVAMTNAMRISQTATGLDQIIGTAGQHNRKLFEIQKAARLAEAALSIPATVISAYRAGSEIGGPIVGAAFAATALAAQLVQLKQIQSASYGSASSGSSGGAGSAPASSAPAPAAQQNSRFVDINLYGDDSSSYSKTSVRKLIERIGEEVKDGAVLRVK